MSLTVALLLAASLLVVQASNYDDSPNVYRWGVDTTFQRNKYTLSSCQMDEGFKDKEKNACTLGVKLEDKSKAKPDEDTTIEVKCGEETTCSYTGKPYTCAKFAKTQKAQIKFYECLIKQMHKKKACEEAELQCTKMCKEIKFTKAETDYYLLY